MIAWLLLVLATAEPPPAADPPKTGPVEHLHKQVVQAIRNCPESEEGEIVVCSRDRGVAEAYRLPKMDGRFATLRPSGRGTASAAAGADVAAAGTGSCSAAGAGGATGCQLQIDNQWGEWKKQQKADGQYFPW